MSSTSELDSLSKREKKTVSWYDQNDQKVVVEEETIVIEVDDESQTKKEKDVEIQVRRVRQSFDLYFSKCTLLFLATKYLIYL